MIALLYYASPNAKLARPQVDPARAARSRSCVWLVASAGFAFYVANFGSYNKTYGALGGVDHLPRLALDHQRRDPARRGAQRRARAQPQLEEGVPGAERELQLDERSEPKAKRRARTA